MRQAFVGVLEPEYDDGDNEITCSVRFGQLTVTIMSEDEKDAPPEYKHEEIRPFLNKKVIIFIEVMGE